MPIVNDEKEPQTLKKIQRPNTLETIKTKLQGRCIVWL